jgi:hypothetical protein
VLRSKSLKVERDLTGGTGTRVVLFKWTLAPLTRWRLCLIACAFLPGWEGRTKYVTALQAPIEGKFRIKDLQNPQGRSSSSHVFSEAISSQKLRELKEMAFIFHFSELLERAWSYSRFKHK